MHVTRAPFLVLSGLALFASGACRDPSSPFEPGPKEKEPGTLPAGAPSLVVANVATGGAFDLDGFLVTVDGGRSWPIELNDAISLGGITVGNHTVELSGVASNCRLNGEARRTGTVAEGSATRVEFEVICVPPADLAGVRFIFSSARQITEGSRIVVMNADGSERADLTDGQFWDYGPAVSPDGGRIAFMRRCLDRCSVAIYSMNADGSAASVMVDGPAFEPAWSPDGKRLAFLTDGGLWGGFIQVSQADGSGATPFVESASSGEDGWPAWSPDGLQIAFSRWDFHAGGISIWTADPDGSNPVRLTGAGLWGPFGPVWSPDGRIAFSHAGGYGKTSRIQVMNPEGVTTLLESDMFITAHDWSSDDQFLLFTKDVRSAGSPRTDIYLLRTADRSLIRLTAAGVNRDPAFWTRSRD